MIAFKSQLFECKSLNDENMIPVAEFRRIRSESESGLVKKHLADTEELLLREIGQGDHNMVDLNAFTDMVDLYCYMPGMEKKISSHKSAAIYSVLSSNTKEAASAEKSMESKEEVHRRRTLEFMWIRIQERFATFSPAFRYFDTNSNNRISFTEFTKGLEGLKVKMSAKDQLMVFQHLDQGQKGYIDYQDFCNLSDERRLNIDPAAQMLKDYEQTGTMINYTGKNATRSPSRKEFERVKAKRQQEAQERTELQKYLGHMDVEDLELITKAERRDKKNLGEGPVIYGQKSPWGQPRVGYSIPKYIKENPDIEYGVSSYHKGAPSELKQLLSNEFMKE